MACAYHRTLEVKDCEKKKKRAKPIRIQTNKPSITIKSIMSGGGPLPIWSKYTSGSKGIWEKVRQFLVPVPNRSTGNPVANLYRAIPPGERVETARKYKDPATIPAGDIKDNAYHKRDYRRNYPRVQAFDQSKVSGLLKLGSAANPRISIGDQGSKELQPFTDPTQAISLSTTLESVNPSVVKGELLGKEGEPIVAPSLNKFQWKILRQPEHGFYSEEYPCRIFSEDKPQAASK